MRSVEGTQLLTGANRKSFDPDFLRIGLASECIASIGMLRHSLFSVVSRIFIGRLGLLHGSNNGGDMFNRNFTKILLGGTILVRFVLALFANLVMLFK